jgi:hypothetical protein
MIFRASQTTRIDALLTKEIHRQRQTQTSAIFVLEPPITHIMYRILYIYISGWWEKPTPPKNDGVKVSWGDEIPNIWKNKIHVPNHQPDKEMSSNSG